MRTKQELAVTRENIRVAREGAQSSRARNAAAVRDGRQLLREQVQTVRGRTVNSARAVRDSVYSSKFVSAGAAKEVEEFGGEYQAIIQRSQRGFVSATALAARAENPPAPRPGWKTTGPVAPRPPRAFLE